MGSTVVAEAVVVGGLDVVRSVVVVPSVVVGLGVDAFAVISAVLVGSLVVALTVVVVASLVVEDSWIGLRVEGSAVEVAGASLVVVAFSFVVDGPVVVAFAVIVGAFEALIVVGSADVDDFAVVVAFSTLVVASEILVEASVVVGFAVARLCIRCGPSFGCGLTRCGLSSCGRWVLRGRCRLLGYGRSFRRSGRSLTGFSGCPSFSDSGFFFGGRVLF